MKKELTVLGCMAAFAGAHGNGGCSRALRRCRSQYGWSNDSNTDVDMYQGGVAV